MRGLLGLLLSFLLMCGADHVFEGRANFHPHNVTLRNTPTDDKFARMLAVFFEQCCARHNNCGSHVAVLKWSLVDNSDRIGQQRNNEKAKETTKPTTPTSKQAKPTSADQSMKR